ncbi:MAG: hypothetical protein SV062_04365, partial [Thermodesulfobacteriota bacterium]|nr:hypothetical protein [Thermodesulfobacteriota bacterium]
MNLKFSVIIALCILFLNLNCKNNINVPDKKIEKEDIPEVKVRAFVDKPEIPPFSRIKYTLIVNTKPGVKISIPEIGSLFKG